MTEVEFIRRRLEGGTLYALLAEESSNYLHVGPFTDADLELLGTSFAKVRCCRTYIHTMDDGPTPFWTLGGVGTRNQQMARRAVQTSSFPAIVFGGLSRDVFLRGREVVEI